MFFIGIFGVQDKHKVIKTFDDGEELVEEYRYFHFFFLPLYKWNFRYLVRDPQTERFHRVSKEEAEDLERKSYIDRSLFNSPIKDSINSQCVNCRAQLPRDYAFCPYCGNRVSQ